MPVFYHIHRGLKPITFTSKKTMFMARKNTSWNKMEKAISKDFGGYVEYKITIPKNRFTRSFNSKDNTKILIIDDNNLKQLKNYLVKNKGIWTPGTRGSKKFKKDFGGIDCSRFWNWNISDPVLNKYYFNYSSEVLIWNYKDVEIYYTAIETGILG